MAGIGSKIPRAAKNRRGSHAAKCDICDIMYWDHQLVQLEDGHMYCTGPGTLNDADGRPAVTLDRLNAEHARRAGEQPHHPVTGRGHDI